MWPDNLETSLTGTVLSMTIKHEIREMDNEVKNYYIDKMDNLKHKYFAATEFFDGTSRVVEYSHDYSLSAPISSGGAGGDQPNSASTLSAIMATMALSALF